MPLKLQAVVKDKKLYPVLHKFAVSDHSEEQVEFIAEAGANEAMYNKYIKKDAPKEVNLSSPLLVKFKAAATANKWSDMSPLVRQAKDEVAKAFDRDVMTRFEKSAAYKAAAGLRDPAQVKTEAAIEQMETNMTEGTTSLRTVMAGITTKGKPANKSEVDRILESGRLRYDKVHETFTERVQQDKAFTRLAYSSFFARKDSFNKLWVEFKKLLA